MKIEELKNLIETNSLSSSFLVLKYQDIDFVAKQYCKEISKTKNLELVYSEPVQQSNNMFNVISNTLKVICLEELNTELFKEDNTIIICKKIDKNILPYYDNVVEIPKLEKWQIKDYAISKLKHIDDKYVNWLLDICKYDIYRLDLEIEKLNVLNAANAEFRIMAENGAFSDLTDNTVFNMTNAIIKKDKNSFINAYSDMNSFDISPMGFWTILLKTFRNIIDIQLSSNPTPESCGLKENQFWAIKKNNLGIYTKEQLISNYKLLIDVDKKIKTGTLPVENLIDYLVIKIH